jgi:adenylate kinase
MSKKKTPKNVAVIFNLPVGIRSALCKKVPAGKRSAFVTELLAVKLKVAAVEKAVVKKVATAKKVAKKAVKKVVAKKKVAKKVIAKKKSVLGRLFKK